MARKSYMFRSAVVDRGLMPEVVPGDPTKKSMTPVILGYVYEIEEEFIGDLIEFMETQKWSFVEEVTGEIPQILPLAMAGSSGKMYDVTIDDSDPASPVFKIAPNP